MSTDPAAAWDDPVWRETSDNRWQAGLRLQQTWWRQTIAGQPAGPATGQPGRLVGSMLPLDVSLDVNLMTPAARAAFHRANSDSKGRPGMIQEDRLRRNALSSQPLCFNLFGHLASDPASILPWIREIDDQASIVDDIRIEWAPSTGTFSGSAFDAFVEYTTGTGERGFVGVECKYHEDLKATLRKPAAQKFLERTSSQWWQPDAASHLDKNGLRQLWFNQLLTQATIEIEAYDRAFGVVVACDEDQAARVATAKVQEQLVNPAGLSFHSIQSIVEAVDGHDDWRRTFSERYTDFSPISGLLPQNDPRRPATSKSPRG
ncbi:hypothetical protein [Aeromicrobium sp. S22]|uniref:PGN_0703 family putative restriction endonuclease n=1 Tax=Aeromicrobium sp. S22 TaxID=2662029 RepID=UPI0035C8FE28